MRMIRWLFLSCLVSLPLPLLAQSASPAGNPPMKLIFFYTQQEIGLSGLEAYGPEMGRWGRLGLGLGGGTYRAEDAAGEARALAVQQHAISWHSAEKLLALKHPVFERSLDFAVTLRLGRLQFEKLSELETKREHFTFLETDALFQVKGHLKDADPGRWVKASSFGVGAGFRLNFIDKPMFIGTSQVNDMRVYPSFQFSLLLF